VQFNFQPGATPRDFEDPNIGSAEGAIQFQRKSESRLQRSYIFQSKESWTMPQASNEVAPLALHAHGNDKANIVGIL
jgi:hypothetical protein